MSVWHPISVRCVALALGLAMLGCTDAQLRRSTVRQASTLTELQYQQVLDNLATLCFDPNVLPWHVALTTGSAQVTDSGTAGISFDLGGGVTTTHPSFFGSRSVVEQWGTVPVTDEPTLRLLRMAYQNALGHQRQLLSHKDANDLAHLLTSQIATTSDMSVDGDTLRHLFEIYRDAPDGSSLGTKREVPANPSVKPNDPAGQNSIEKQYGKSWGEVTDTLDDEILVEASNKQPFFAPRHGAATGLAKEVIRQVNDVQDTLLSIPNGWLESGSKRDVPSDACYVGRHGPIYVWVCREHTAELAEFTLGILKLSSVVQSSQVVASPSGIQFSPGLIRPQFR